MRSAGRAPKSCLIKAILLALNSTRCAAGFAVRSHLVCSCCSVVSHARTWLGLPWQVRGVLQGCPEEKPSTTVISQGLLHPVVLTCGFFFLFFQDLIEKVVILRKAVQLTQAVDPNAVGALLAEKMSQYANLLAAQGSIAAALTFLPANTNQVQGLQVFFTLSLSLCEQVYFKQRSLPDAVSKQDCHLKCTSGCDGQAVSPLHALASLTWQKYTALFSPFVSHPCPCSQWLPKEQLSLLQARHSETCTLTPGCFL